MVKLFFVDFENSWGYPSRSIKNRATISQENVACPDS